MENMANVFIQVIEKPERKVIIKRGKKQVNTGVIVRKSAAMWGF